MKILLFGKNGQVGSKLQRALAPLGGMNLPDWQIGDARMLTEIQGS